ncbi:Uncharacterised protein [Mycobacteroides abscessus subsp. abscessus]|nr:Uncharacterised protein [Mycobacteroides abscessus subsp. abscessus]
MLNLQRAAQPGVFLLVQKSFGQRFCDGRSSRCATAGSPTRPNKMEQIVIPS